MVRRSKQQWQDVIQAFAKSGLSTKAFCLQHNIPLQTFYARRHSLGLTSPLTKKSVSVHQNKSAEFVQAKVLRNPSHIVMQTREAQLSLPVNCDPVWLARLLKGISA